MQLMKKILGVGLSLVASVALANESGAFVGIEGGMINSKFKGEDYSFKDNVPTFGIKAGYILNPSNRIYGAYNYVAKAKYSETEKDSSFSREINVHKFLVGYDFTPQIATNTRAVVGVYGGIASLKDKGKYKGNDNNANVPDLNTNESSSSFSASGRNFIYGGKLGALYEIGAGEIEGGFKVDQVSYKVEEEKLKQTNLGLYIGYNYKF